MLTRSIILNMRKYEIYEVWNNGTLSLTTDTYCFATKRYAQLIGDKSIVGVYADGTKRSIMWSGKCRVC